MRRKVLEAFRAETGIADVPRQPEDPYFWEFTEFCREAFRRYVRHYVNTLHARYPHFQITSNWAFSSTMPEPVSIDLDYLSGDTNYENSVNAARFEGRCLARQGKPWDLMAWSFWADRTGQSCTTTKSAAQLKQEAAVILSLGGGFQAYFNQRRDGSPPLWLMPLMADVARFCRARQAVCHRAEAVPQVALLYAGKAFYRHTERLFGSWDAPEILPLKGVLQSLLDAQEAVEITMEHHLAGRMGDYPLIVVPEWEYLDPTFMDELRAYVRNGGNLLADRAARGGAVRAELQVELRGELQQGVRRWLAQEDELGGLMTDVQEVNSFARRHALGDAALTRTTPRAPRRSPGPSPTMAPDASPPPISTMAVPYAKGAIYRVRGLYPRPGARALPPAHGGGRGIAQRRRNGQPPGEPADGEPGQHRGASRRRRGALFRRDTTHRPAGGDDPLRPNKPHRVTLQPGGTDLDFALNEGEITLALPKLELHEIIVID